MTKALVFWILMLLWLVLGLYLYGGLGYAAIGSNLLLFILLALLGWGIFGPPIKG